LAIVLLKKREKLAEKDFQRVVQKIENESLED
jgi:hypothetical protein